MCFSFLTNFPSISLGAYISPFFLKSTRKKNGPSAKLIESLSSFENISVCIGSLLIAHFMSITSSLYLIELKKFCIGLQIFATVLLVKSISLNVFEMKNGTFKT